MSRTLPHAADSERCVLGAVLLAPRRALALAAGEGLVAAEFFHPANAAIWQAMVDLDDAGSPVDEITVVGQLRANGAEAKLRGLGGEAYFAELTSAVVTVENIGWHAREVRQRHTQREMLLAAQAIAAEAYDPALQVEEFADRAQAALYEAAAKSRRKSYETARKVAARTLDQLDARGKRDSLVTGVPSGLVKLDTLTAGYQPGYLYIIAGRPSMGKTALVMRSVVFASVESGIPSLIFSLEMPGEDLLTRSISDLASIDGSVLRTGKLDQDEHVRSQQAAALLARSPLYLDDSGSPTLQEIRAKARRWKAECEAEERDKDLAPRGGIVAIDYLQLVTAPGGRGREQNREGEVSEISRGLKALARELSVPVVALSQLNRGVESRSDKRPQLSDLRESGAIEQDADLVAFVYRDEYYNKETTDRGVAEIIIGKQRNGPTGTARVRFTPHFSRFEDLDEEPSPQAELLSDQRPRQGRRGGAHSHYHPNAPGEE
jgi:replicative DNA helicase